MPAVKEARLLFCCGSVFAGHQHLSPVVQVAIHGVGVVEHVHFPGSLASAERGHCSMVVCAASAGAALGVPPFWIWHDAVPLFAFLPAGGLLPSW